MPEKLKAYITATSYIDDTKYYADYDRAEQKIPVLLKMFYDKGIRLLAGTDGGEQFGLVHELQTFADAGIPIPEILRIATYVPAEEFKLDHRFGSVKAGRELSLIHI